MESIYPELALCGRKNADTVFFPISEVSEGTVFLLSLLSPFTLCGCVFRAALSFAQVSYQ